MYGTMSTAKVAERASVGDKIPSEAAERASDAARRASEAAGNSSGRGKTEKERNTI